MATNLFAPLSEQTKKDILVEFRAGRLHQDTNSKMVRPDKRKGQVQLKMNSQDNLIHFVWKDRTTGTVELDLMLFPDDAVFRKVEEAKGRVYVLEFKTSDKKLFFWLQEAKDEKDKENCDNINKYINNPPPPPGTPSGTGGSGLLDLVGGLGLDQNQLLQLLSSSGGLGGIPMGRSAGGQARQSSSGTSSTPSTTSSQSQSQSAPAQQQPTQPQQQQQQQQQQARVNLETLQNILANITSSQEQEQDKGPSLKDVVNVDEIVGSGLFDNPEVVSKLAEFLPAGPVTAENLKENIQSPQFKQAVSLFNQALRSGQLSTVMTSFGLDASSVGPNATIEDFLMAIQKKAKEDAEKPKEKEKDEKMDTSD